MHFGEEKKIGLYKLVYTEKKYRQNDVSGGVTFINPLIVINLPAFILAIWLSLKIMSKKKKDVGISHPRMVLFFYKTVLWTYLKVY